MFQNEFIVSNRILAVVVTYFPEEVLFRKNISAFLDEVDEVLIWENTPEGQAKNYRFIANNKVSYYGDGVNSISHALNYAWKYAESKGYDYLLTMDQDSVFENFKLYKEKTILNDSIEEGIWIPLMVTGTEEPKKRKDGEDVKEVFFGITSGMLLKTTTIQKIGGWNEAFTIDGVDCEFSFHAKRVGIKIFCFLNIFLRHQLGEYKKVQLMGRSFELRNYSPRRYFAIYRNHVLLMRMFPEQKKFHDTCIHYWGGMIKWIFMFENQRFKKLFYISKGILIGCFANINKVHRKIYER